ncbi:cyclic nucleotide-binding domain-containing protein [Desulfobacula sp.]|uniref:Cyclic nucleotide-binding domain-containing protein n=1 Tax=Candidatus Desulfatibia vada TaxID=2841696 RepID=A0A8J6TP13_9BACT|nr:cyclic nucleotide-binding domain-containing protein [Candidatus Desulfatibia vada]MBL6996783.1 cyclic nucleotide-binding domain-containing protein [Desulfobacula sp.]
MFQIASEETYQDGQIIFKEGSAGDWIYTIEEGAVELYKQVGAEKIVVSVLQSGDMFGELAYFAGIRRTVSTRAVGATTVGIIDRSLLDKEYNRLSGDFRMILKNLVLRFEKAIEITTDPRLRRKSPRIPKTLALSFKSKAGFIKAFSEDISTGGMFIKTTKPLAKGEQFILKLKLPDASETIKINCEVSWNRTETSDPVKQPLGMGINFIKISPKDHHRLKKELIKSEIKK